MDRVLGKPDRALGKPDRVVIVGAGLSGLTIAYVLNRLSDSSRRPIEISVLDAKDRVGGAVWTREREGFTLEAGADSFITNKPAGVELCRELGLEDRLMGVDSRNRRSFVVRNGRLHPVPEGLVLATPARLLPLLTTPILSLPGKLRLLLDLIIPPPLESDDESLASFIRRRFGGEVLDRLVEPLVAGIYTADPSDLSLRATLPHFLEMEREYGGLIRAGRRKAGADGLDRFASGARYGLFATLREGMKTLPETLAAALPSGTIQLNTSVRRIARPEPSGPWRIELLDGEAIDAEVLVLACEAHASARLVDGVDPELAMNLRAIPYASSAIVHLAFRRDQVAHPLDGFGAVVPRIEGRPIIAISFTSVKFPIRAPAGTCLFRVFVGGAARPELFELDDDRLAAIAREQVAELLGARGEPLFVELSRHPRAMPQYVLGHLDRVQAVKTAESRHVGLIVAGNAFEGVGIPDSIRSARAAAERVLHALPEHASEAAA